MLGIPGGTVRSRINRARAMLKRKLQPLAAEGRHAMKLRSGPQRLFGAYWDDELDAGRARVARDRTSPPARRAAREYEELARTLELVGSLPRVEATPDCVERVLARARRAAPAPDRAAGRRPPRWVPVDRGGGAAAGDRGRGARRGSGSIAPRGCGPAGAARDSAQPELVTAGHRDAAPTIGAAADAARRRQLVADDGVVPTACSTTATTSSSSSTR